MGVVVFAKVQGATGSADFETFFVRGHLKKKLLPFIFCGTSIHDKNSKFIGDNAKILLKDNSQKNLESTSVQEF